MTPGSDGSDSRIYACQECGRKVEQAELPMCPTVCTDGRWGLRCPACNAPHALGSDSGIPHPVSGIEETPDGTRTISRATPDQIDYRPNESKPGRLVPPYPVGHCAAAHCRKPLVTRDDECFLYTNLDTRKLVVFCDDCARNVELNHPTRFALVAV